MFTHKELVEIAYRWVLKNCGAGFAFKELKSIDKEIPDIIAFDSWQSILIECKISRSDFFCDKNKPHRLKGGMGNWRFYCCPDYLITKQDLPLKWGLITVNSKGKAKILYDCRKKKVQCEPIKTGGKFNIPEQVYNTRTVTATENKFEADLIAERRIMYTALRRLFIKGHVKHIYDKKYSRLTANDLIELNKTC